jgi:hypothetical protein
MAMGAFPIQSHTACADEWFKKPDFGIILDSFEPIEFQNALKAAIAQTSGVQPSFLGNQNMIRERATFEGIHFRARKFYE